MKFLQVLSTLAFLTVSIGMAQGPLFDKITVSVPYPMHVNGAVLQPGDYEIRQHDSVAGGSRILHFYTNNGMVLETTAMAIPTVDSRTPSESKLVLDHYGSDYYLHKVWVQGKDYGYEFPLPDNVKMRENEQSLPSSASVRYDITPPPAPPVAVAQTVPPPEPAPVVVPPPIVQPAPAPEPQQLAQNEPTTITPPPPPMVADRGAPTMPSTAGNWLSLVLSGAFLTSSGLVLRRFKA